MLSDCDEISKRPLSVLCAVLFVGHRFAMNANMSQAKLLPFHLGEAEALPLQTHPPTSPSLLFSSKELLDQEPWTSNLLIDIGPLSPGGNWNCEQTHNCSWNDDQLPSFSQQQSSLALAEVAQALQFSSAFDLSAKNSTQLIWQQTCQQLFPPNYSFTIRFDINSTAASLLNPSFTSAYFANVPKSDQLVSALITSGSSSSSFSQSSSLSFTSFDNRFWPPLPDQPQWMYTAVLLLIALGVGGNLLVCLAICTEKRLQNATNYFLLSLAVADLLVSMIVMPFLMICELYGE